MSNIIKLEAGKPVVSSVTVATEFGRRHKHVLDTIDSLIADGTITEPEFRLSHYVDDSGKSNRWFVSEITPAGTVEWMMRPLAISEIVRLIEKERTGAAMVAGYLTESSTA